MCLIVAAVEASERYRLLLCANRDERHARPSAAAGWWRDAPTVIGGRDLVGGGSWLALTRSGRLAAVTNYRTPAASVGLRSRGELVSSYVIGDRPLDDYEAALAQSAAEYGPFSLLLLEGAELRYTSNRAPPNRLGPGVHALSNAAYGVEWPKTASARAGVEALLATPEPVEPLFALLAQRGDAQGDDRYRSAHFIAGEVYGTRSSTVVLIERDGTALFAERSFDSAGRVSGEVRERFALEPARRTAASGAA
jgi:uncharacterized protein with NRDE domain